jgi:hypothetical protein
MLNQGSIAPSLFLRVAQSLVPRTQMIFIPDSVLQRVTSIVLVLYVGAFLGQALCALHESHGESRTGAGAHGASTHAATTHYASASMVVSHGSMVFFHGSNSTGAHVSASMTANDQPHQGAHSSSHGQDHSGACSEVACASGVTATSDHGLAQMNAVSSARVAYRGGMMPPDAEMVPPPPRLS